MKKIILLLSLFLFAGQISVAQKFETKTTKKTKRVSNPKMVIDFISKGNGIDQESLSKIENFIKNYPKKPAYEITQKGKEGEKKIALSLTELNADEQADFIAGVKSLIVNPDMVLISSSGKKEVKSQLVPVSTNYRLVISFISQGPGIDREAHDKIRKYIEKNPKKPVFEEHHWGREGEVDYCLQLKEFTPTEQQVFVEDVKKMISNKEMVFVTENQEYVKKGR